MKPLRSAVATLGNKSCRVKGLQLPLNRMKRLRRCLPNRHGMKRLQEAPKIGGRGLPSYFSISTPLQKAI